MRWRFQLSGGITQVEEAARLEAAKIRAAEQRQRQEAERLEATAAAATAHQSLAQQQQQQLQQVSADEQVLLLEPFLLYIACACFQTSRALLSADLQLQEASAGQQRSSVAAPDSLEVSRAASTAPAPARIMQPATSPAEGRVIAASSAVQQQQEAAEHLRVRMRAGASYTLRRSRIPCRTQSVERVCCMRRLQKRRQRPTVQISQPVWLAERVISLSRLTCSKLRLHRSRCCPRASELHHLAVCSEQLDAWEKTTYLCAAKTSSPGTGGYQEPRPH